MINITIVNDDRICYLDRYKVRFIIQGNRIDPHTHQPEEFIEVHTIKGIVKIDNMKVKDFHNLLSSGKAETIKNKFHWRT